MADTPAKPRRRWFRFGLRTLFVAATAVACWLGYQLNWIRQRHDALRALPDEIIYRQGPEIAPPLSLRPFGEQGVTEFAERFSDGITAEIDGSLRSRLQDLFPEAFYVEPVPIATGEWPVPW